MIEGGNQSKFAIFQNADGEPAVAARFENDDIWLTRQQLADLYHTTPQNVGQHLKAIESSGELDFSSKRKKFFTLGESGGQVAKVPIYHYNLDEIIALGYKIDSPIAIRFRKWATERLHEYIVKGFTMDDECLKQGGNRCLKRVASGDRVVRRLCGAMDEKH